MFLPGGGGGGGGGSGGWGLESGTIPAARKGTQAIILVLNGKWLFICLCVVDFFLFVCFFLFIFCSQASRFREERWRGLLSLRGQAPPPPLASVLLLNPVDPNVSAIFFSSF